MKKILLSFFVILMVFRVSAQDKPAYQIFTGDGHAVKYSKMLKELKDADFVFYGELHNNAIAHWLELEITRDLFAENGQRLVLGAEMFESDNQLLIDELYQGFVTEKKFTEDCRLWKNYATDYKPLLMFALEKKLPFVATNVPRRYASLVASKGLGALDTLSAVAKSYLPPLPIEFDPEVPCYKNMLSVMGEQPKKPAAKPASPTDQPSAAPAMPTLPAAMPAGMGAHGGDKIIKAQALKDATMAWFINRYYQPGKQFIHYNGSYHSDNHEGIVWYLRKHQPKAKIVVITTVSQEEIRELDPETKGKADYVVAVPDRMTNTY